MQRFTDGLGLVRRVFVLAPTGAASAGIAQAGADAVDRGRNSAVEFRRFRLAICGCGALAADEFDLVYCSSVIEHVPRGRRAAFAAEVRRVGRGWYVQTPAYAFPIEPHSLLPGAHWLPARLRRPYWRLGAAGEWQEISLLRRAELERLFGPALPERFGPLVKSWVSVRAPKS